MWIFKHICTICAIKWSDATGNPIQNGMQMKFELYDVFTTDFPFLKIPYSNIKINLHSLKTNRLAYATVYCTRGG